jgi:hypothetical protein
MQQPLMTFHFKVYASLMDSGWQFFNFFNYYKPQQYRLRDTN